MKLERIKGMVELRECVNTLIKLQLDEYGDVDIRNQQEKLNSLYDRFTAEFGLISSDENSNAFNADSSYYLLSALEIVDDDGNLIKKAPMFTQRTIKPKSTITHVDTASEALAVSIGEKARIDMEYMSALTGKDEVTLFAELRGIIFLEFETVGLTDSYKYRAADEFLSGNVREKLKKYQDFLEVIPKGDALYEVVSDNVAALEAVQPKDLDASEIFVRLGSTWLEQSYVQQFMYELLKTSNYNKNIYRVNFIPQTGDWEVSGKGRTLYGDIPASVTYGTDKMNAYRIIEDTLNLKDVRVYDIKTGADGIDRRVLNRKETALAQQKQELIKQQFKDWLWKDTDRRQLLVEKYNELYNSTRPREYNGSHLVFSGMSPVETLRPYQLNAIAHILYGGNTLLAHDVGAGKTFEMVAAAMESKRLGLCHKSLFAVPKNLVDQIAGDFLRLYPSANILVAQSKDFEMKNRKRFCAKIATGDYDAVIIGHTQLERIPMSRERQARLIREEISEIESGIRELKRKNGNSISIKGLERTKKSLNRRLTKLLDAKKRDDVVTFEQLGCDRLYIDEAHNFKNLATYTKMRNIAGVSTAEAQKSSDLYMKCQYLNEITNNRGVIFSTATPISNSMVELYTMQRYLQLDTLKNRRLAYFDAWASIFGETTTSIELAPEGTGYRARTRFAQFNNLPELMNMFRDVADIQTKDMLNLPVPMVKFENIVVEPSPLQKEMVKDLSKRAFDVHNRRVLPEIDNMLKITTDGRKIGLDARLMNPNLPDFTGSKINACVDNVFKIWEETRPKSLSQLIFCDYSTPNKDGRFNIYDDIKEKLLDKGIPEHEIAFIHDADSDKQKRKLFSKVRTGKIRVLLGSTAMLGAGTNVQDKLIASHDLDCPWRPADLEQRAGRIIRFGNENPEVSVFRYCTSGTFDSYLWQAVQKKQEYIAQIMSSKTPARSCEDVDETALSYAEIKALCAGDPRIKEKMELDIEVAKLRMLRSSHNSQHYRLEDSLIKLYPQKIASTNEIIQGIQKDIALYESEKAKATIVQTTTTGATSTTSKFAGMNIKGTLYSEKEVAGKALLEAFKGLNERKDMAIGEYMGFKLSLSFDTNSKQINLYMRGAMTYKVDLGTDAFGNITRINHALDELPRRLQGAKDQLANLEQQIEATKAELKIPFTQEAELREKELRLVHLNVTLDIDSGENFDASYDDKNRDGGADVDDYGDERPRLAAKAKPTLLESIRNYNAEKKPRTSGNKKLTELSV
jgi:N12 class adenine-specific DNA methylase